MNIRTHLPLIISLIVTANSVWAEQTQLTIGFQKSSLFTIIKSRQTLQKAFKDKGVSVCWIEFKVRTG